MAAAETIACAPSFWMARHEGAVTLVIGEESWTLTLAEADVFVGALTRSIAEARATESLARVAPGGLARMGGHLFAKA